MTDKERLDKIAYVLNLYLKSKTTDSADETILKINDIVYEK